MIKHRSITPPEFEEECRRLFDQWFNEQPDPIEIEFGEWIKGKTSPALTKYILEYDHQLAEAESEGIKMA